MSPETKNAAWDALGLTAMFAVPVLMAAVINTSAQAQQALPPMTEQQQINAWKARALAAEQRAQQAEQLATAIQQPNPVPETRPVHWVKYDVDGRNVIEFKSKLNPGMVCVFALGREGIACVRN